MHAIGAGLRDFRGGAAVEPADPLGRAAGRFVDWESRRARYEVNWALYQNVAYDDPNNPFAAELREAHGLDPNVRNLYNPAYRLAEFWRARTLGGTLDPEAGDGESEASALPIQRRPGGADPDGAAAKALDEYQDRRLRRAISRLWADSDWQVGKDTYTLFGAVFGDSVIMLQDDADAGKVRMRVAHPGSFVDVERMHGDCGPVVSYIREEPRPDPVQRESYARMLAAGSPYTVPTIAYVHYREEATLEGGHVRYRTYRDGVLYPWDGVAAEWTYPAPFIPVVFAQHQGVGLPWGLNCFHAGMSRFREVDEQASILSDQIRKALRAPSLISGMRGFADEERERRAGGPACDFDDAADPECPSGRWYDRDRMEFLFGGADARVHTLLGSLDIGAAREHILDLRADIGLNFLELLADIDTASGDASGRALREARKRVTSLVQARRPSYEGPMVLAHRMAMAIGGAKGYEGYEGYTIDAYDAPETEHRIGHREVFEVGPADEMEAQKAALDNYAIAVDKGIPWQMAARMFLAFAEEDLAEMQGLKDEAEAKALALMPPPAPKPGEPQPPAKPGEPGKPQPPVDPNKAADAAANATEAR